MDLDRTEVEMAGHNGLAHCLSFGDGIIKWTFLVLNSGYIQLNSFTVIASRSLRIVSNSHYKRI